MNDIKQLEDWRIQISILDRGFVAVGHVFKEKEYFILKNGFMIRYWGTTEGLGELAEKGKLEKTKLDKLTVLKFHEKNCIGLIKCNNSKWSECNDN